RADVEGQCLTRLLHLTGVDEFHLSGVSQERLTAIEHSGLRWRLRDRKPVYAIDLDGLRRTGGGMENVLGRNTRYQLRRSIRWYEMKGPLEVVAAASTDEAIAIFDELKVLHQGRWRARGQPGAFALGIFECFHRDLIADRFATGNI